VSGHCRMVTVLQLVSVRQDQPLVCTGICRAQQLAQLQTAVSSSRSHTSSCTRWARGRLAVLLTVQLPVQSTVRKLHLQVQQPKHRHQGSHSSAAPAVSLQLGVLQLLSSGKPVLLVLRVQRLMMTGRHLEAVLHQLQRLPRLQRWHDRTKQQQKVRAQCTVPAVVQVQQSRTTAVELQAVRRRTAAQQHHMHPARRCMLLQQ
jgi:hypothetical protein